MKSLIISVLLICCSLIVKSQCFQIESVLVDGCDGSNEGMNEMVRFKVGNSPLSVSTLTVNWPNNSWLGVCQSASTATSVAAINATILGCGFLKEPVAGVLPANSKVLLVTSTNFNPYAQSFVNLTDTLIIIFQCAGNTAGHFANYAATPVPSLRTLSMSFSGTCTDAVTYNRNDLIKQNGTIGGQDGGAVEFDPAGNPTYVNRGCMAPFVPITVNAGPNRSICSNLFASFTATISGTTSGNIQWSGGTGIFSNPTATTTTYTPGAGETGTVNIFCTVNKTCGTQTLTAKDTVVINILQIPQPVITASSATLCFGQSATLSYSLSNNAAAGTTTNTWLPTNSNAASISVNTATIYTVTVSNSCGVGSNTIGVSVIPNPTIAILASGPTQFCAGGNVILTANSSEGNYQWSTGATAQTISVSTTTNVVVTTTNSCSSAQATQTVNVISLPTVTISPNSIGICTGGSALLQANVNTAVTYTWSTGNNTNAITVNTAGIYTVSVSNACGNANGTATVTNTGSAPVLFATASPTILCSGQSSTLSLSGSSGTYAWSNGANTLTTSVSSPGVYTATVTNSCGTATTSINIGSLPTPTILVSPSNTIICNAQPVVITANSNVNNYNWSTGATTNTVSFSSGGTYSVNVSNVCGVAVATVNITQQNLPVLNLSSSTSSVCPNETATLTVVGGSAPYTWSNITLTGSVVTTNGGVITVSNSNICGTATASILVTVNSINASIIASPAIGVKPLVVEFANNSTGATFYTWDFANGNSANTQTVIAQTYTTGGDYIVTLVASNGLCVSTATVLVTVFDEEPGIVIPNVFTPNGDSINDIFKVTGFNIIDFECAIFDRWGLQLFNWNDINKGWDGKTNGKSVPDGTYFYIINAKDISDKEIKKQGSLNLFK